MKSTSCRAAYVRACLKHYGVDPRNYVNDADWVWWKRAWQAALRAAAKPATPEKEGET